jgi:hypothetical protein
MKTFLMTMALCGALAPALLTLAEEYGCGCQDCRASCGHRCPACPKCSHKICTSCVEKTKEEHHCFNVECKEICVPKITLPCWTDAIPFFKCKDKSCGCGDNCPTKECCDAPRCGYVKVVKVLKKHEYECDSCGYKWTISEPCTACPSGACQSGGYSAGGYAPAPCATGNCPTGACTSGKCSAPVYLPDLQPGAYEVLPEQPPVPPQAGQERPAHALPLYTGHPSDQQNQRPVNLRFAP